MIAGRRDERRAPALEEKEVGEEADEPEKRKRYPCADDAYHDCH
jgi:hypothetical protein